MKTESVEFTNDTGHRLSGRLELPIGPPRAYAVFAHCFTCSKTSRAATVISRSLTDFGFAVLRFDFTGLGTSEGEFADTSFTSNVSDITAAAGFLREHHRAPQLLIGHSLGGAAVLRAAHGIPEVTAICTIGAPASPDHVSHLFSEAEPRIREQGSAEVSIGGQSVRVGAQFLDDIAAPDMLDTLSGRALLIMHSPLDEVVAIEEAEKMYTRLRGVKSFVSLHDTDHLLSKREDAEYAAAVLAAWSLRYIAPAEVDEVPVDEGHVLVHDYDRPYTNRVVARQHHLLADEPKKVKGLDAGPTPYELLLAGLGACTSITLRMYADRKNIPLEHVSVQLRYQRLHGKDCEDCESESEFLERIEKRVRLDGPLDDAQREKLLEISKKCPVHRTLLANVDIRSALD